MKYDNDRKRKRREEEKLFKRSTNQPSQPKKMTKRRRGKIEIYREVKERYRWMRVEKDYFQMAIRENR